MTIELKFTVLLLVKYSRHYQRLKFNVVVFCFLFFLYTKHGFVNIYESLNILFSIDFYKS